MERWKATTLCGICLFAVGMPDANASVIFHEGFDETPLGEMPSGWDVNAPVTPAIAGVVDNVALGSGHSLRANDGGSGSSRLYLRKYFAPTSKVKLEFNLYTDKEDSNGIFVRLEHNLSGAQWAYDRTATFSGSDYGGYPGQLAVHNGWGSPNWVPMQSDADGSVGLVYELNTWYRVTRTLDLIADTDRLEVVKLDANGDAIGSTYSVENMGMATTHLPTDVVTSISLMTSGGKEGFGNLDEITAWDLSVPEPTTLAIWGTLGGLGLIAARRRRKAA